MNISSEPYKCRNIVYWEHDILNKMNNSYGKLSGASEVLVRFVLLYL
jgi:hypothetical protein